MPNINLRCFDYAGFYHSNQKCVVQECGVLLPGLYPVDTLNAGQVGYFFGNIRNPHVVCFDFCIHFLFH